jgi:hypothetical protein
MNLNFKFNQSSGKFENVFSLIYSVENLQKAWKIINGRLCETTFRGDLKTFSSYFNTFLLMKISRKLELGRYKYSSFKKIIANNRHSLNTKVVILSSFCDVVIQNAFCYVLQKIYEGASTWQSVDFNTFKTCNYSAGFDGLAFKRFSKNKNTYEIKKWVIEPIFSPNVFGLSWNTSVHAVLKRIKVHWGEVNWFWSTRLVKNFKNINYHRVINELEKTIDDKKLTHEIWKMCREGVISLNKFIHLNSSVFDENVLSAFCAMLRYVHRLFKLVLKQYTFVD